jgi:hypothetical protein
MENMVQTTLMDIYRCYWKTVDSSIEESQETPKTIVYQC